MRRTSDTEPGLVPSIRALKKETPLTVVPGLGCWGSENLIKRGTQILWAGTSENSG